MPKRLADEFEVVGVDAGRKHGGIPGHGLRRHAEDVVKADARIRHAGLAVRRHPMLIEACRNDRGDFVVAILQLQPAHRFGRVTQRAVIIERGAGFLVTHQPHAFLDPDALAGLVAVDFGDEAGDATAFHQHLMDFGAAIRIHIPFRGDVVAAPDELLLGRIAVQPHQRRVGADHPAVERRAEYALADIVVEVAEASLRRAGAQQRAVALRGEHGKHAGRDDGRGKEPSEQALPSRPGRHLCEQHDDGQGEEQGKRKRRRDKCMCAANFVPQPLNDGYA